MSADLFLGIAVGCIISLIWGIIVFKTKIFPDSEDASTS